MPAVHIADRRIWVGDESRALLSGEVHYWRLDRLAWPAVLQAVRDLGLDVISTYVCWDFHEIGSGAFDFRGQTNARRDLLGFLDLAQREGFWVLLRPGPYIYAEWPNSGIPERVVRWHRLHPEFKAEASVWLAAVMQAVQPFLATHGGPIVLLQADNEADPWLDVYGSQIGLADEPGLFQSFLERRYDHIAELNATWGTALADFSAARAVTDPVLRSTAFDNRYLDLCRFRHAYAMEVVRWTTAELKRLGSGDVPVYANTYGGWTVQDWHAIADACDDLVGPDIYPSARVADDPHEHRRLLEALRYSRTCSVLPFIAEFEAGIWHGWHADVGVLSATHHELIGYSALLAGVSGWNWYMLVGRDNWYMSPITELGRPRPDLIASFASLVEAFRALDPPSLDKVTYTAVTFNALERAANLSDAGDDVLAALYAADIDYEFFDVQSGQLEKPLVLYAGGAWLAEAAHKRLLSYVEAGGTLVFFQSLPVQDERLQPLNLLGLREPDGITSAAHPQRVRLGLGSLEVDLSSAALFSYAAPPGEPLRVERIEPRPPTQEGGYAHVRLPVGERIVVGYVERRGQGRLVVLGLTPTSEVLLALHVWLGIPVACRASSPAVHSALFRREDQCFVALTNTSSNPVETTLHLDDGSRRITVRVPAGSGAWARLDD